MTVVQPFKILISACILLTVFFIYDEENLYYREDLIHLFVPYFFFLATCLFDWAVFQCLQSYFNLNLARRNEVLVALSY